jgi:hypothetical protein
MGDFDFKTRHALSILVILLIIIFLFQPSIFGTMINTLLGRFTLLFILILITGYHRFFGIICVLLIIALYEYYNRFEGLENQKPKPIAPLSAKVDKNKKDKGSSKHSSVPSKESHKPSTDTKHAMTQSKKTAIETQILKKHKSSELPSQKQVSTQTGVTASESSTTKTKTKSKTEGFASMFGSSYALY